MKKFLQSLQFRLIVIVLTIFIVSNIILVSVSLNISTSTNEATVSELLNAVTDSAAGKIKGETEKQFRMITALAEMDVLKDESVPLIEKCQ